MNTFDLPASSACCATPFSSGGCCPRYIASVDGPPAPIADIVELLDKTSGPLIKKIGPTLRVALYAAGMSRQ